MELRDFFEAHNKIALAFSGGTDSAYLLYSALSNATDVTAYYVKTQFQPQFELEDALRLAKELSAKLRVLELDVLADERISSNPADRCYYCKSRIFSAITAKASEDGYTELMDGTNLSDRDGDRPGMRALRELKVYSPLRLCGLSKAEIRERSRAAGLFTWDKPAYACLATRLPIGQKLTATELRRTELAEDSLRALGLRDFRVRTRGELALVQVTEEQFALVLENRNKIMELLRNDYSGVALDLIPRPGSAE